MKNVCITWTPSPSAGVDEQRVRIVDDNDGTVYGEQVLSPTANEFCAMCPEGATVVGFVVTARGEQVSPARTDLFTVPYGQLQPATDLGIGLGPQATNPIA